MKKGKERSEKKEGALVKNCDVMNGWIPLNEELPEKKQRDQNGYTLVERILTAKFCRQTTFF